MYRHLPKPKAAYATNVSTLQTLRSWNWLCFHLFPSTGWYGLQSWQKHRPLHLTFSSRVTPIVHCLVKKKRSTIFWKQFLSPSSRWLREWLTFSVRSIAKYSMNQFVRGQFTSIVLVNCKNNILDTSIRLSSKLKIIFHFESKQSLQLNAISIIM